MPAPGIALRRNLFQVDPRPYLFRDEFSRDLIWVNLAQTITPSLGAELLTDPGLEWGYTAGNCDSLTKSGSPSLVQSADVHGGSKAQQFTATIAQDRIRPEGFTGVVGRWYIFSVWAKRTAGSSGTAKPSIWQNTPGFVFGTAIVDAAYTQHVHAYRAGYAASLAFQVAHDTGSSGWDTVIVDDVSVTTPTLSSLVGVAQTGPVQGIWSRLVTVAAGHVAGFWFNWDGNTNGTEDYVEALVDRVAGTARLSKCVNGTISDNLTSGAITYVAGANLEVTRVGNVYTLYYNGVQVGSPVTISDASIISNSLCANFQTDPAATGNLIARLGDGIDLARWTRTDTERKLSQSGGNLSCLGGASSAGVADPAIRRLLIPREPGLCVIMELTPQATRAMFGFGDVNLGNRSLFDMNNQSILARVSAGLSVALPATYTNGSSILLMGIAKTVGHLWYISTDAGITWKLIFEEFTTTYSPLYAWYGSISMAFTSVFCRVLRGFMPPVLLDLAQMITPVGGSELLVNPDMETWTDSTHLGTWARNLSGTSTLNQESSIVKTGTYSARLDIDASNSDSSINQAKSGLTVGAWYLISVWGRVSVAAKTYYIDFVDGGYTAEQQFIPASPGLAWVQAFFAVRATHTTEAIVLNRATSASTSLYFDTASLTALTLSSLVGAFQTGPVQGIWARPVTVAAGYQAGFWLNSDGNTDGTADYVEAIVDRSSNKARLSKCVNGTVTNNLISAAITYSAGAILEVVRIGTSYCLYYNGAIVGAAVTISDAGITNNNLCANFQTDPNATGNLQARRGIGIA